MTEIEAIVEPNGIADDFWWESVAFVSIHRRIIDQGELTCQYLDDDCVIPLQTENILLS
jgi:hypothetical protein